MKLLHCICVIECSNAMCYVYVLQFDFMSFKHVWEIANHDNFESINKYFVREKFIPMKLLEIKEKQLTSSKVYYSWFQVVCEGKRNVISSRAHQN